MYCPRHSVFEPKQTHVSIDANGNHYRSKSGYFLLNHITYIHVQRFCWVQTPHIYTCKSVPDNIESTLENTTNILRDPYETLYHTTEKSSGVLTFSASAGLCTYIVQIFTQKLHQEDKLQLLRLHDFLSVAELPLVDFACIHIHLKC